jgi:hypothetical protein
MKKSVIIIVCVLFSLALLVPVPRYLKDGGTVEYNAVLYQIRDVHSLVPEDVSEDGFVEGTVVKILGLEVFNNVK